MKNIIILLFALLIGGAVNAQSYKVIVNSSNTTASITKKDAGDYFLKKKTKWASGDKIAPVDQSSKAAVRAEFSKEVIGKSVNSVKSYWQQAVFAGKGTPPVEKKTDADVIEYVKSNSGAIGYVSSATDVSGVKVLTVN